MSSTGTSKNNVHYRRDPLQEQIDEWGKLDGDFNYRSKHKKYQSAGTAYDWSHLNQIENEFNDLDKLNFNANNEHKHTPSTERWRQNDKFKLQENPLLALNESLSIQQHHSHLSNDDFQFPKVTY